MRLPGPGRGYTKKFGDNSEVKNVYVEISIRLSP